MTKAPETKTVGEVAESLSKEPETASQAEIRHRKMLDGHEAGKRVRQMVHYAGGTDGFNKATKVHILTRKDL